MLSDEQIAEIIAQCEAEQRAELERTQENLGVRFPDGYVATVLETTRQLAVVFLNHIRDLLAAYQANDALAANFLKARVDALTSLIAADAGKKIMSFFDGTE